MAMRAQCTAIHPVERAVVTQPVTAAPMEAMVAEVEVGTK